MTPEELELEVLDEGKEDTEVVSGCCAGGSNLVRA